MRAPTRLEWLYLDLNSYFASVEQQLNPELRDKPVAVVPAMTDSTCAIAASYEAKAYGVKTGTMIYDAKKRCPDLICVQADHEHYVAFHHRIKAVIDQFIPIEQVCSIDEVACQLQGKECTVDGAVDLARRIKAGLKEQIGAYVRCSIGVSTNRFLAKMASNLQKPDGLTVLFPHELPQRIHHWKLSDICGIGCNMERRLQLAGIGTVEQLWQVEPKRMRRIWGGVGGERFWYNMRGYDLPEEPTTKRTVGHSHVLEPAYRPPSQARQVARRLTAKAASRLRRLGYHANEMHLSLRIESGSKVRTWTRFYRASDSITMLAQLNEMWDTLMQEHRPRRIKKISVSLFGLVKDETLQPELFQDDGAANHKQLASYEKLSSAMDKLNSRFGRDSVVIGSLPQKTHPFSGTKIAFTRVPDQQEFQE